MFLACCNRSPQDFESYRNTVGVLHETWEEAAAELDQCRLSQRRAQEEERRREAEARKYERGGYTSRTGGRYGIFGDDYPSGSDGDDDEDADPFNFFTGTDEIIGRSHGRIFFFPMILVFHAEFDARRVERRCKMEARRHLATVSSSILQFQLIRCACS